MPYPSLRATCAALYKLPAFTANGSSDLLCRTLKNPDDRGTSTDLTETLVSKAVALVRLQ